MTARRRGERFGRLRERLDPDGRFANGYLDRVLGPVAPRLSPDGHR